MESGGETDLYWARANKIEEGKDHMAKLQDVQDHYEHGGELLGKIESALAQAGKSRGQLTIEDLAAVDEFHTGGRTATLTFLNHLNISPGQHFLDIGCGIGGTARLLASEYASRVTGIDLTREFVETGNVLCEWTGLDDKITLQQGSALSTGLEDASFDGASMLHVGMNIEDKAGLCREVARLLKADAQFGIYDIMKVKDETLDYPVPWASSAASSFPGTPADYKGALANAGFEVEQEYNQLEFALDFMAALKKKNASGKGPSPLGLHVIMGKDTALKVSNMVAMMARGILAPIEIIARKKS